MTKPDEDIEQLAENGMPDIAARYQAVLVAARALREYVEDGAMEPCVECPDAYRCNPEDGGTCDGRERWREILREVLEAGI